MISEIYATGSNATSAFLIVEAGEVVHFGAHQWPATITFDGITNESDDDSCLAMAVICGLMMCWNNNRILVNVYTQDGKNITSSQNPFAASVKQHADRIDIHWDTFPPGSYHPDTRQYRDNPYVQKLQSLITNSK